MVDENLTWVDTATVENKSSKNLGLLYKAKNYYLNRKIHGEFVLFLHTLLLKSWKYCIMQNANNKTDNAYIKF